MKRLSRVMFFLFFIWTFLINNSVYAVNFQIDQAKIRMKMPPGWSDGGVIKVQNKSNDPLKVRVYVSDWVYTDQDGSKDFMPAGTNPSSCAEWIKFYPADFTVPARGEQKVNFVVAVPPDASGGHYAVLFFEAAMGYTADEKGGNVKVYNRLGSLFYIEADGTLKKEARLSGFKIWRIGDNIEAEATLENIGNVDITAKGVLDIIDDEGLVLTRAQFNDAYTFPKDKAKLQAKSQSSGLSQGKYDAILTFDLEDATLVKEYQISVSGSGEITDIKETE